VNLERDALLNLLSTKLPRGLATSLVDEFLQIRVDVVTGTLGRASPGKFVENLVRALQHLDLGTYEPKPSVDDYLSKLESRTTRLDDGLRVCAARIGRAMYTLRNKRSIAHSGDIDPNSYDLAFLLQGAQWILAELVRVIGGSSMAQAGELVAAINAPVGGLVDDFGGQRVVVASLSAPDELLVLLHYSHPAVVLLSELKTAMRRRAGSTIRGAIAKLWRAKLIEGDAEEGYRLTSRGYDRAISIIKDATGSSS